MWFRRKKATTTAIQSPDQTITQFGNLAEIETIDCRKYSSCRGHLSRDQLIFNACAVSAATDQDLDASEDLSELVYGTYLWDELCHQGTLYSVTPIGAYYICKKVKEIGIRSRFLYEFLAYLNGAGTGGILLNSTEVFLNKAGMLPIFRLEEIFDQRLINMMSAFSTNAGFRSSPNDLNE